MVTAQQTNLAYHGARLLADKLNKSLAGAPVQTRAYVKPAKPPLHKLDNASIQCSLTVFMSMDSTAFATICVWKCVFRVPQQTRSLGRGALLRVVLN